MLGRAAKRHGGKWAEDAFPHGASLDYDEVAKDEVHRAKMELEQQVQDETWEVVDGFQFPYAQTA